MRRLSPWSGDYWRIVAVIGAVGLVWWAVETWITGTPPAHP